MLSKIIAEKIVSKIEGQITEICTELDHENTRYFISGYVHCSYVDDFGGSDEYGNVEQLSRCIGCEPYIVVTWFDEHDEEHFIDTTPIEIEIKKQML